MSLNLTPVQSLPLFRPSDLARSEEVVQAHIFDQALFLVDDLFKKNRVNVAPQTLLAITQDALRQNRKRINYVDAFALTAGGTRPVDVDGAFSIASTLSNKLPTFQVESHHYGNPYQPLTKDGQRLEPTPQGSYRPSRTDRYTLTHPQA
ncbi:MAG: hypothetical protein ACKO34_03085 [Vampirovibrionales bacterium]